MAEPKHSLEHQALGRAVRWARARRGLSQEELGFRSRLHRNYVGAIERGEINPTYRVLLKLGWGLRMTPSELLAEAEMLWEAIPANPLALVRAPRAEHREQVRPLAPTTIERIRAELDAEGAAVVAVLAYAGLRPGELRALRWGDIRERTILVQRGADPSGEAKPTKTRSARTVRLLAPLAADLKTWRLARGRPDAGALVFTRDDGEPWTKDDWDVWRANGWRTACKRAKVRPTPRPYDLRHSFASLLLAEGRTVHYVAAQLGHSPVLTLSTYGHLIAEYADTGSIDAEAEIVKARAGAAATLPASLGRLAVGAVPCTS
jgi:integrase